MATKSISQLDTQATANETDLFEVAIVDANSASGYASKKESGAAIADAIMGEYQYPLRITGTTAKTIAGAINEVAGEVADLKDLEGSASGDIASFVDGSANPLKALTISIVATQSGSGDPSPTNVRPITGWTGANVSRTGVNIWDEHIVTGMIADSTGELNPTITSYKSSENFIPVKPAMQVYVYFSQNYANLKVYFYDKNKTYIGYGNQISGSRIITIQDNAYYIKFRVATEASYNNDISINYPSTDTTYHAYNGTTYNINWQSTVGTVYGGTLDVKTGELIVTWKSDIYDGSDDEDWRVQTIAGFFIVTDKKIGKGNYLADNYTATNENAWDISVAPIGTFSGHPSLPYLYFRYPYEGFAADLTAWRTWLASNNVHVIYELATPVTYQLTPTEVRSLLGVNNVWADCGSITELKYIRDLNLCINDIIARLEALEGASNTRSLSVSPVLTKSLTSELDTAEGITKETEEETKEEAQKNER